MGQINRNSVTIAVKFDEKKLAEFQRWAEELSETLNRLLRLLGDVPGLELNIAAPRGEKD
jgi:hypothetical protein